MNFRFMNHYDLCRWHEINTGFESSQHIDGKKHIQGFLPQMFQLWDVFFFFDATNGAFDPPSQIFWIWKIQASDGILVASKLVKHFGGKKTPNISGFQTNLPWKNVLAQRLGADLVSLKGAEKKTRVKKRWWPRKRRWIPRPCKRAPGFSSDEFLVFRPMLSWLFEIFRNCSLTNICHLW